MASLKNRNTHKGESNSPSSAFSSPSNPHSHPFPIYLRIFSSLCLSFLLTCLLNNSLIPRIHLTRSSFPLFAFCSCLRIWRRSRQWAGKVRISRWIVIWGFRICYGLLWYCGGGWGHDVTWNDMFSWRWHQLSLTGTVSEKLSTRKNWALLI